MYHNHSSFSYKSLYSNFVCCCDCNGGDLFFERWIIFHTRTRCVIIYSAYLIYIWTFRIYDLLIILFKIGFLEIGIVAIPVGRVLKCSEWDAVSVRRISTNQLFLPVYTLAHICYNCLVNIEWLLSAISPHHSMVKFPS